MVKTEKFFVENNGVKLEAEYYQTSFDKILAVLICHPHPQFGGNMWNNVTSAIFTKLMNANISCLRFNFRGVGHSTGGHSDGEGELSDVKACVDFLTNNKKINQVLICGYSYGAAIGCSAVNSSEKIIGYVAISFPWDFMGSEFKELSQTDKPKLFIQGDRDQIASYKQFDKHMTYYRDPKEIKLVKGADHFYIGREDIVATYVLEFYQSLLHK